MEEQEVNFALLREEENRLIKLIEALSKLDKSKEWQVLKEMVFDKSLASIERQMMTSVLTPDINIEQLYKLQGEWAWAKQFADIDRFVETLKKQLEEIKKKLK